MAELESVVESRQIISGLLDAFTSIETDNNSWHEYIDDNRRQYTLRHWEDPKSFNVTIGKPHNVIVFAKAILAAAKLNVKAVGFMDSEDALKNGSLYEKFCLGVWDVNRTRQPGKDPKEWFLHRMLVDGCGAAYCFLDPDYRPPSFDYLWWAQCPVTIEAVDPKNLYVKPSVNPKRNFDYVFSVSEIPLFDLVGIYPNAEWQKHAPSARTDNDLRNTLIKLYHYTGYDLEGNVVQTIFTDELLLSDEVMWPSSMYPGLPWIIRGCYTGDVTVGGSGEVPSLGLVERYQSLLHPISDQVGTVERVMSGDMRAHELYSNMPPVAHTENGRQIDVEGEWGEVITLRPTENIGFPQWPGNPPDSTRLTQFHMADISEGSFSAAAMGYAGSAASGYHVALTTESSRTRLHLPAESFASAIAEVGNLSCHFLRLYYPVTTFQMFGQEAGKPTTFGFNAKMAEGLLLSVEASLRLPGDDVRKVAIAGQMKGIGVSRRTIFEDILGIDQPDEEMRRVRQEMAETHPIMQLLGMIDALKMNGDPRVGILEQALQKAVMSTLQSPAGAAAPGPNQAPQMRPMGTEAAPQEMQGAPGPTPGAAPPTGGP